MANDTDPVTRRVYSWLYCVDWWDGSDDRLPPCTRDGAHSDRVRDALVWAIGRLAHPDAPADWDWLSRIASADDSKGWLTITLIAPVPHCVCEAIARGWWAMGNEPVENVTFRLMGADEVRAHEERSAFHPALD